MPRRTFGLIGGGLLGRGAINAGLITPPPTPTLATSPAYLGVFVPNLVDQVPPLTAFETYLGRPVDFILGFLDSQPTWTQLGGSAGLKGYMEVTHRPVSWTFPMLPTNGDFLHISAAGNTLVPEGTGTPNSFYTQGATTLSSYPYKMPDGTQLIRLGHEFPAGYPWFVNGHPPYNTPANFIQTWINIVTAFRAVSNQFRFVWCSNSGNQLFGGGSPGLCYPGDAYVDFIGTDAYQQTGGLDVFSGQLNQSGYGIQWAYDFSQCLGGLRTGTPKPFILGEWGVWNGGAVSDSVSAQYIQDQWNWINGTDQGNVVRNVGYTCFWDGDVGSSYNSQIDVNSATIPVTAAKFKSTFGTANPQYAAGAAAAPAIIGVTAAQSIVAASPASGTTIAALSAQPKNGPLTGLTYSITSQTAGAFQISGSTLQALSSTLTANTYSATIRVASTNAFNTPQSFVKSIIIPYGSASLTLGGANFTWRNQGAASTTGGGASAMVISTPANPIDAIRYILTSTSGIGNYTASIRTGYGTVNYYHGGLVLTKVGSVAATIFGTYAPGPSALMLLRGSSGPTDVSTLYGDTTPGFASNTVSYYLRISFDGSVYWFSGSSTGLVDSWIVCGRVSASTLGSPDQIGFYLDANDTTSTGLNCVMTANSWRYSSSTNLQEAA